MVFLRSSSAAKDVSSDHNTGKFYNKICYCFLLNRCLDGLFEINLKFDYMNISWQLYESCRYCSNIYPDADSYGICNWCLSQKDETAGGKEHKVWNSSGSIKIKGKDYVKNNKKKSLEDNNGEKTRIIIKKQKSLDLSLSSGARKRITKDNGKISRRLRRTRSEEITNGGIEKHVTRNKVVRRYKHLDEVNSQSIRREKL